MTPYGESAPTFAAVSHARDRVGVAAGPVVGNPEIELRDCARWVRGRELLHRGEPVLIPGGERRAELRLQRVVTPEDRGRLRQTVPL